MLRSFTGAAIRLLTNPPGGHIPYPHKNGLLLHSYPQERHRQTFTG